MEELLHVLESLLENVDPFWKNVVLSLTFWTTFWLVFWIIPRKTYSWWKNRNPLSDLARSILTHLDNMRVGSLLTYSVTSKDDYCTLLAEPLVIHCHPVFLIRIRQENDPMTIPVSGLTKKEVKKIGQRACAYLRELEEKDSKKQIEYIKNKLLFSTSAQVSGEKKETNGLLKEIQDQPRKEGFIKIPSGVNTLVDVGNFVKSVDQSLKMIANELRNFRELPSIRTNGHDWIKTVNGSDNEWWECVKCSKKIKNPMDWGMIPCQIVNNAKAAAQNLIKNLEQ